MYYNYSLRIFKVNIKVSRIDASKVICIIPRLIFYRYSIDSIPEREQITCIVSDNDTDTQIRVSSKVNVIRYTVG